MKVLLRKKGEQMLKIKNLNHSTLKSGSFHQYRSHDAAPKNGEYTLAKIFLYVTVALFLQQF